MHPNPTKVNKSNSKESFGLNSSYDGISYDGISYDGISYTKIIFYWESWYPDPFFLFLF